MCTFANTCTVIQAITFFREDGDSWQDNSAGANRGYEDVTEILLMINVESKISLISRQHCWLRCYIKQHLISVCKCYRPEVDCPTQPPMMSFKQFLQSQDDNITDEEAIRKFNDYKLDFKRQQIHEFFLQHKDEEW